MPFMCCIYVATAIYILIANFTEIPSAISLILDRAFTGEAAGGGFLGVLVIGTKRAVFSNEAGVGSAAIAHSAAKTDEPVSEGIVALLEPFIDTVVVCSMTGLVIVITGCYDTSDAVNKELIAADNGAALTMKAMGSQVAWFKMVLCVAVVLFAYSTLISWSYYGERCSVLLFGPRASLVYKLSFVFFAFLGSILSKSSVLDFSDLMILSMAFPNILGVVMMSGTIKARLDDYWGRYLQGKLEPAIARQA